MRNRETAARPVSMNYINTRTRNFERGEFFVDKGLCERLIKASAATIGIWASKELSSRRRKREGRARLACKVRMRRLSSEQVSPLTMSIAPFLNCGEADDKNPRNSDTIARDTIVRDGERLS